MRDQDALKLKVMKILLSELSEDEFLHLDIRTKQSPADIKKEQILLKAQREAIKELEQEKEKKAQESLELEAANLAEKIGVKSIALNEISISMLRQFRVNGSLSEKQIQALKKYNQ